MMLRSRRVAVVSLAAAIAVVLSAGAAFAFWTATSSGSGNSNTDTLAAPVQTNATSVTATSAQINWTPMTTGWQKDAIYTVTVDAGSQTCNAAASVGNCSLSGLATGTSYVVTLTAAFGSWTSAASNTKTVTPVASDTTAPSSIISFPPAAGVYNASGWTAGCTVADSICGTATDDVGGSGVTSVAVSVQATSGANATKYWTTTAPGGFTSATEVKMAASYSAGAWRLAFPAANLSDATYSIRAYATDNANNTQASATSASFTYDNTAPSVAITKVNGTAVTFPFATKNNVTSIAGTCGNATPDGATVSVTVGGLSTVPASATCSSGSWSLTFTVAISAQGSYAFVATQPDSAGNSGSSGTQTVIVDKTAPTGVDVQTVNGTTNGLIDGRDQMSFKFSEAIDSNTVLSGWNGTSTSVQVQFNNSNSGVSNQKLSVLNSGGTTALPLGLVGWNVSFLNGGNNGAIKVSGATMTLSADKTTVTVTLPAGPSSAQAVSGTTSTLTWTPAAAGPSDIVGNQQTSTTSVTESGSADLDF